jgi:hypothetical protein
LIYHDVPRDRIWKEITSLLYPSPGEFYCDRSYNLRHRSKSIKYIVIYKL